MSTDAADPPLYDADFFTWTERQADLLRREAELRSNARLDWLNLAEEIESLGKRDRRSLESRLTRLIEHLLKLEFAPVEEPRRQWERSVVNQRRDLHKLMRDSPSLRRVAGEAVAETFEDAAEDVARSIPEAEMQRWPDLPTQCPYTLDQLLDPDFWPPRERVP